MGVVELLYLIGLMSYGYGQNCREEEPPARKCENLCRGNGTCKIKAALLLPKNTTFDASLPVVEPIFELAMQDDVVRNAFPPWVEFEWKRYDVSDCDAAYAVISAIDAYNDCSHVFFGPSCDFALASVARITKFLGKTGTPLVTTGGFTFDFVQPKQNCHHEYYMMVRSGPLGFKDMAYFIIDIMRHYDWRQLLLINEPEAQVHVAGKSTCLLMMKTFANYLKKEDIIYTPWDTTSDGGLNYTENLKFYLGYKFGWTRAVILYETPGYMLFVGASGGYLMASSIHQYMLFEGINVYGREIQPRQPYKELLLENVGNNYASEFRLSLYYMA
ncbi:unnamed protein product [Parnassius mnemosyne]|uniref:Receptor ligand binding region domain-containing protein n=1 Tax=Parnassius mnemosyne TaxID=213953 RepID=A0AAV1LF88_9NEOP